MAINLSEKYGPWALVTGASDGIGREIAREAAANGLNVVLVARRAQVLEDLAAEVAASTGVETRTIAADLSKPAEVDRVLAELADTDVGLFAACAGFGSSGGFLESDIGVELEQIDVNCRALMRMTHEMGRRFADRGRGGIVLMSSLLAFQGVPRAAHYAATKAYVQSLAEGLRIELAPRGVDVLACAPGPIHSGFASRADMQMSMGQGPQVVAGETLRALGRKTTVRPGFLSKFLEFALKLPRWGRVRIMTLVMDGMTKHQDDGDPVEPLHKAA